MSEHDIITSVDEIEWNDNMIVFETDCCVPYNNHPDESLKIKTKRQ